MIPVTLRGAHPNTVERLSEVPKTCIPNPQAALGNVNATE